MTKDELHDLWNELDRISIKLLNFQEAISEAIVPEVAPIALQNYEAAYQRVEIAMNACRRAMIMIDEVQRRNINL